MPAWLVAIGNFVRTWWQILVAVLILLFAVFVVRPFKSIPDPGPEDVAAAWNTSIGRLGIQPLYPPTEDFGVGDVLAVVADSENVPLLGKAVRIAHIDLRDLILASTVEPVFADTADLAAGSSFRKQDRTEVATDSKDRRIRWPSRHFRASRSAMSRSRPRPRATPRDGSARLETETRSRKYRSRAPKPTASRPSRRLSNSTIGAATKKPKPIVTIVSSDKRLPLRSATGCSPPGRPTAPRLPAPIPRALKILRAPMPPARTAPTTTGPKEYAARLQLQLVTRVYLTREIEQRRMNEAAAGAAVQALADPSQAKSDPAAAKPGDQSASAIEAINRNLAASGATGAKIAIVRSDGVNISLQETFQRPIAFGFRAVTISLTPSVPGKDQVP
jgi:hypothetical protein